MQSDFVAVCEVTVQSVFVAVCEVTVCKVTLWLYVRRPAACEVTGSM